ncbi:hypothetical protein SAMN04515665_12327 [Blastococcus sp. DSM 46786]|uniref:hypothetical protein n=1 Tax=Blastococcus sp. DSM 46786 TaxID=1798227 RepID=UPI0008AF1024|nr:hypothetical protein [Blastococcus sp. DSM 46786]SEL91880.1 hypothetical protein SAMN04515665_12327 [Blastococcus sp. DSM 46786]
MSERDQTMSLPAPGPDDAGPASGGATPSGTSGGATSSGAPGAAPAPPLPEPTPVAGGNAPPAGHATAPVGVRPAPRKPRRGPMTVMGPWAPVAGGLLGLFLGLVAVLLLAGSAETFADRLSLTFAVLGLGLLGAAGVLLADEVRIVRQRSREAGVRPQWVEATAGLVNGLTPARLLLLTSAFVLFLSAYVAR